MKPEENNRSVQGMPSEGPGLDKDDIFTEAEAAAFLRMTPRMLADRRLAGRIGFIKDGGYVVFTRQNLLDYRQTFASQSSAKPESAQDEIVVLTLRNGKAKSLISELTGGPQTAHRRIPRENVRLRTRSAKDEDDDQ